MSSPNLSRLVSELDQCLAHWRETAGTPNPSLDPHQDKGVSGSTTIAQELPCLGSQPSSSEAVADPQLAVAHNRDGSASPGKQQSLTLSLCKELISKLGPDLVKASLADVISHGGNASSSSDRPVGPGSATHHSTQIEAPDQVSDDVVSAEEPRSARKEVRNKRKRSEVHEPPEGPPTSRAKHVQGSGKTITFNEVYQNGRALMKHQIVQFPDTNGKWYILFCEEHNVFFKDPVQGAIAHLASTLHTSQPQERADAIEHLGVEVVDCNQTLADRNNASVIRACKNGYNHPRCQDVERETDNHRYHRRSRAGQRSQKLQGVIEPIPGEVYLAYWKKSKDWSAVLLLPYKDLLEAGVNATLHTLGLMESVPECYRYDRKADILTWRLEYEPEGELAHKRQFPVMYFDGQEFPTKSAVGWAAAEDLQHFDVEAANAALTPHYKSVRQFLKYREGRNAGSLSREILVDSGPQNSADPQVAEEKQPSSTPPPTCDDDNIENSTVADSDDQALRERAEDWNPSDISDLPSDSGDEVEEKIEEEVEEEVEEVEEPSHNSLAVVEEPMPISSAIISDEHTRESFAEDVPMADVPVAVSIQTTEVSNQVAPLSPAIQEPTSPAAASISHSTPAPEQVPEQIPSSEAKQVFSPPRASPLYVAEELPPPDADDDCIFDSDTIDATDLGQAQSPMQGPSFRAERRSTLSSEHFSPDISRLQSMSSETSTSVMDIPHLEPRQGPPSSFVTSSIACLAQKVFETMQPQNQYASHHGSSEHCGAGSVTRDPVRRTPAGTTSRAVGASVPRAQPTSPGASTSTLPREARQPAATPVAPRAPEDTYTPLPPPSTCQDYARIQPRPTQALPELQLAPIRTPSIPSPTMLLPTMQHSPTSMQPPPVQQQPSPSYTSQQFSPINPATPTVPYQAHPNYRPMPLHPPLQGGHPSQPDFQITNNPSGPEFPTNPLPPMFTSHPDDLPPAEIAPLNWGSEVISPRPARAFMNDSNMAAQPQAQPQIQPQGQGYSHSRRRRRRSRSRGRSVSQDYHRGHVHADYNTHHAYPDPHTYAHPYAQTALVAVSSQAFVMARAEDQSSNSGDEVFPTGLAQNPMKGRRRNFKPLFVWPDDVPPALVDFCVRYLQSRGLHPGPVGFASDFISYNCHFCPDTKGWYVAGAFLRHLKKRHGYGCDKAVVP